MLECSSLYFIISILVWSFLFIDLMIVFAAIKVDESVSVVAGRRFGSIESKNPIETSQSSFEDNPSFHRLETSQFLLKDLYNYDFQQ